MRIHHIAVRRSNECQNVSFLISKLDTTAHCLFIAFHPKPLVLVDVDDVRVAVGQKTSLAPLTSNTRLLVTTKDSLRRWLLPRVNKDGSGFKSSCNLRRLLDILTPHTGTETSLGVVCAGNDLLKVRPWLCRDDGAEWLFLDDARVVGRVVDDGGLDEVSLGRGDVGRADGEFVALGLTVFEESLDLLELHLVLNGAEQVVAVIGVARL